MVPPYAASPGHLPASAEQVGETISAVLGSKARSVRVARGEVTVVVAAADYLAAATLLRDEDGCKFEQLIDLCATR